ncbi:MAG: 30S ribosomal protein S5 [Patescibacteria group bacterium]
MSDEKQQQPAVPAQAVAPQAKPSTAPAGKPQGNSAVTQFRGRSGGGDRGPGGFRGRSGGGGNRGGAGRPGQRDGRRGPGGEVPAEADYEEKNLEVARVTRVTKGGKRMRFRVLAVIGNRKGRVGFGLSKGVDVAGATGKATTQARKSLISVPLIHETIPHAVTAKFRAAVVLIKPAPKGTGVKAGGAIRSVLELAGVPNVVSKMLGSSNKTNNVKATFLALKQLRMPIKAEVAKTEEKPELKGESQKA